MTFRFTDRWQSSLATLFPKSDGHELALLELRDRELERQIDLLDSRTLYFAASTDLPAITSRSLRPGQQAYITGTSQRYEFDGTGWLVVSEPEQPYTPTIVATGTSPTGWTMTGGYQRHMGRCTGWGKFVYGSGTAASGTLRFGIPFDAAYTIMPAGVGTINDSGVAAHQRNLIIGAAASYAQMHDAAGAAVSGASPMTPGASDYYAIWFNYQMSNIYE